MSAADINISLPSENYFSTSGEQSTARQPYSIAQNQHLPIILFGIIMITENAISTNLK